MLVLAYLQEKTLISHPPYAGTLADLQPYALIMLNLFIYYSNGMFKMRSTQYKLENSFWNENCGLQ